MIKNCRIFSWAAANSFTYSLRKKKREVKRIDSSNNSIGKTQTISATKFSKKEGVRKFNILSKTERSAEQSSVFLASIIDSVGNK